MDQYDRQHGRLEKVWIGIRARDSAPVNRRQYRSMKHVGYVVALAEPPKRGIASGRLRPHPAFPPLCYQASAVALTRIDYLAQSKLPDISTCVRSQKQLSNLGEGERD